MHCVGDERGPASLRSGVGLLRISLPRLVSVLFPGPTLLEMKFFRKLFPPSSKLVVHGIGSDFVSHWRECLQSRQIKRFVEAVTCVGSLVSVVGGPSPLSVVVGRSCTSSP